MNVDRPLSTQESPGDGQSLFVLTDVASDPATEPRISLNSPPMLPGIETRGKDKNGYADMLDSPQKGRIYAIYMSACVCVIMNDR